MLGMERIKNKIVAIVGPTAVGKTNLALQLSRFGNFEVISADSRQIYKYLDIGTAKPSILEREQLKHHLIDILKPSDYYSAGNYAEDALKKYSEILSKGKYPLLVGGSGLYIKALIEGFSIRDDKQNDAFNSNIYVRKEMEKILEQYGKEFLYNELFKVDPEAAALYPDKNPRRIIRALEFYYSTGKLFSESFNTKNDINLQPYYIGLYHNREILYDIINKRVDKMWDSGLIDETKNILKFGYSRDLNSLNTVGYKESISYIDNLISKEQAIELIKRNTRRYAKRQITWFKAISDVKWHKSNELELNKISESIKRFYQF